MTPENRVAIEGFEEIDPLGDIEPETQVKLKGLLALGGTRVAQADRLFTSDEYRSNYLPGIVIYTLHYLNPDKAFEIRTYPLSWQEMEKTNDIFITFVPDAIERGHGIIDHGEGATLSIGQDKNGRIQTAHLVAPHDSRDTRRDLFGFEAKGPYAFSYFPGATHLLDRLIEDLSKEPEFVSTNVRPNSGTIGGSGWEKEQRYIRRFVVSKRRFSLKNKFTFLPPNIDMTPSDY